MLLQRVVNTMAPPTAQQAITPMSIEAVTPCYRSGRFIYWRRSKPREARPSET